MTRLAMSILRFFLLLVVVAITCLSSITTTTEAWNPRVNVHRFHKSGSSLSLSFGVGDTFPWFDTALAYRHRPEHEEQVAVTPPASSTSTSSSVNNPFLMAPSPASQSSTTTTSSAATTTTTSSEHGMNMALMRDLALGQMVLASVAAMVTNVCTVPHHAADTILHQAAFTTSTTWEQSLLTVIATAGALIGTEMMADKMAPNSARRVHFDTNNLVVTLWGRRGSSTTTTSSSSTNNDASSTCTTTIQALGTTVALASLTALCQQAVFFHNVPMVLQTHSWGVLSTVIIPAVVFGAYHWSPTARNEENQIVVAQQTAHGFMYAALAATSSSTGTAGLSLLWIPTLAQTLYTTHLWTSTWHAVNDQIDWAQEAPKQRLSPHDAHVWAALQAHSQGALTEQQRGSLQRFFYAFDTDQQGYLSLDNVQTAMAYAFTNADTPPSPAHVQALFGALLDERPVNDHNGNGAVIMPPNDRLSWVECVRLLVSLRAAARRSQ